MKDDIVIRRNGYINNRRRIPLEERIDVPEVRELSDSAPSLFPSTFSLLGGTKPSNSASESSKISPLQLMQCSQELSRFTAERVLLRHVFNDLLKERAKHIDEDEILKIDYAYLAWVNRAVCYQLTSKNLYFT